MNLISLVSFLSLAATLTAWPSLAQEMPNTEEAPHAQETTGAYAKGDEEIEALLFEEAVVPLSNTMMHLLETVLPAENGQPRALGLNIAPASPDDGGSMMEAVFICAFGRAICEPFFRACARVGVKCSPGL